MPQQETWEKEYQNPQLVTKDEKPQKKMLRYFRFHRFRTGLDYNEWTVLDLGCGTGRNANFLASKGAKVTGIDISKTALELAMSRAKELGLDVDYLHQSIGEKLPLQDESQDLILDITSSNSLNEQEREIYLKEAQRVLKPGGAMVVRALLKDRDKNAKNLLKLSPGPEDDTYIIPGMNLVERVFSQQDFRKMYGQYFKVHKLEKTTSYTKFQNQPYKRNFLVAYLIKE